MSKIQEAASYRGVVIEHAVGATKEKGLPQLVLKLRALERFDVTDKTWVDWSNNEDCEITAYLVLISGKGEPIFHAKDIQKVFEWDGVSLTGLNLLDLENAEVQFEVQDHEYKDKETVQVSNIRKYNDEPGSSIKKLDDDELTALNAKFNGSLKKLSGGPKAATAKAVKSATSKAAAAKKGTTKKNTAPPAPPTAPTEAEATAEATKEVTEVPVEEAIEEFKKKNKVPPPPAAPVAPPAPTTTKKAATLKTMTYESAWTTCYGKKSKTVDDATITAAFTAAMHRQAPGVSEEEISGADWALIAEAVIGECG